MSEEARSPTMAELIREHGKLIGSEHCHCCGNWSLYRIGGNSGFLACLLCDTTRDSRLAANLGDKP